MNEAHCRCPGCGECSAHAKEPKLKAELRRLHEVNTELLEALKEIVSIEDQMYGSDWVEIEQARSIARAAIAKATGEQA